MFDSRLRALIDPPLNAGAARLARHVTAGQVTAAGVVAALLCFVALAAGAYMGALAFLLLSRLCDGLDGAVARARGTAGGAWGGYADILADFLFYGGFVFFFAWGAPDKALAAAFLLFGFYLSGASFLAAAIVAARHGEHSTAQGKKSFHYAAGLAEGGETIAAFIIICLWPGSFTAVAAGFGLLCLLTAAARAAVVYNRYGKRTTP